MRKMGDERQVVRIELGAGGVIRYEESRSDNLSSASPSTMPSTTSYFFVPRTTIDTQPSIKSMVKIKAKQQVDKLAGGCFLWSDIPFRIAKNKPFYQSMFDVVTIIGPEYKAPTYDELRGPILPNEKLDCTYRLEEHQESWETTTCNVMLDG
jgi:hypothetical protein